MRQQIVAVGIPILHLIDSHVGGVVVTSTVADAASEVDAVVTPG